MFSDILRYTKTVAQREILSAEIDRLLASLFQKNEDFEKALSSIRAETARIIRDEFLNKNPDANKQIIKNFLGGLKEKLENLRLIKLSLAFFASEHSIDRIYDWIAKNVGDRYILDIQVDPSIIAGASISFEGRYIDLSLRKTVEQVFSTNKKEIVSFLS